jgi:hypothetical protein
MIAAQPSYSSRQTSSPWALYALIALAATALALLTTAQAGVALVHEGHAVPWIGLLKARLVDWYACALFMPLLLGLSRRYPIRRDTWAHHLPILLLASVPVAIAKETIFVAVGDFFRPGVFDLATILSEDLSYEVMAVWAFIAVAQLLVGLQSERTIEPAATGAKAPAPPASASILVRTRRGPVQLSLADIEYVDAQGNYARLVTAGGRYLVRDTMARLESRLGGAFLRVHRSAIVRRDCVRRAAPATNGGYWLELTSGARLRSGRSYRDAIRAAGLPGAGA